MVTRMFEMPATSNGSSARDAGAGPRRPVVMVAGATGGVGKRVVRGGICLSFSSFVAVVGQCVSCAKRRCEHALGNRRQPLPVAARYYCVSRLVSGQCTSNCLEMARSALGVSLYRHLVPQVEALLRRGKRVRALVRDEAKGRQLLVRLVARVARFRTYRSRLWHMPAARSAC